ncbi:MAG: UDP-galactopyranose mutase [Terriglobales bacterium]
MWLIVGAGLTGATIAERVASQLRQEVLVMDRRPHIAGNVFDHIDEHGVLVHAYGPHAFHTNDRRVFAYLSQFTAWRTYEHRVVAEVCETFVPIPFNLDSLAALFSARKARELEQRLLAEFGAGGSVPILKLRQCSDSQLRKLAEFIYREVFQRYTRKQWGLDPEELSPAVTARVPVRVSTDDRYFLDAFQAIPRDGYTAMVAHMLESPRIHVALGEAFSPSRIPRGAERVVFTGAIDEFFSFRYGPLPYRSLRFERHHSHSEQILRAPQINFPNRGTFTRMYEFKQITGQLVAGTTVATEYPEPYDPTKNEPFYPVPIETAQALYRRYATEGDNFGGSTVFAGRLGDYRYYNMDQAVARGLSMFGRLTGRQALAAIGNSAS